MRSKKSTKPARMTSLTIRLDRESKTMLSRAAGQRGIGISEFVRTVAIGQAQREVESARHQTICMTADEQLAFWAALCRKPKLTAAQRRLGAVMRGDR